MCAAKETKPTNPSTKAKLLAAGVRLVVEKGFNNISVEDITKTAGVAKGSFYTYFKRKEDLIQEINRSATEQLLEGIASANVGIEDKLQMFVVRFVTSVQENDIQICRQWLCNLINAPEIVDTKDKEKLEHDIKELRSLLKEEIYAGHLKKKTPIALIANLIMCQIYGMLACWCMSEGSFVPKEWAKGFCEAQIRPILKPYFK